MDPEQTLRGLLRGFGLEVGDVSRGKLPARVRELASGHATLERIVEPMLTAREAIWCEFDELHREVLAIAKADETCRRLMTVPGAGAVVSGLPPAGGRFCKGPEHPAGGAHLIYPARAQGKPEGDPDGVADDLGREPVDGIAG